ncbi:hypothetical protein AB0K43_05470 [Kitasatospora sp. NPDC049258]
MSEILALQGLTADTDTAAEAGLGSHWSSVAHYRANQPVDDQA